jgi:hypothetical protein
LEEEMNENYDAAIDALAAAEGMFSDSIGPQAARAQAYATLALVDAMKGVDVSLRAILELLRAVSGR